MRSILCSLLVIAVGMFIITGCSKNDEKDIEKLQNDVMLLLNQKEFDAALEKAKSAFEKAKAIHGVEDEQTAATIYTLGLVHQAKGDIRNAEKLYLTAIQIYLKKDNNSIEAAKIINNVASLYFSKKKYDLAGDYFKKALAIAKNHFPEGDPKLLAIQKNIETCMDAKEGKIGGPQYSESNKQMTGAAPATDYVPAKVKQAAIDNLKKLNIVVSKLTPEQLIAIGDKGIIFPYRCVQEGTTDQKDIPMMLLFAAIKNEKGGYVFQKSRIVSLESYQETIRQGGMEFLKNELVKIFPDIFS